jgi:hypothetical protein
VADLPKEAEKLLAVAPDRFVSERNALAKALRAEGRQSDAAAVAELHKPSAVVFAANRAARDRPKAARAAADAAVDVRNAQVEGSADALEKALGELDDALDMLAQVALAHLAPSGKKPTEDTRRRLRALLRNAAADEHAREELARGTLTGEVEVTGFGAYAGLTLAPAPKEAAGAAESREGPSGTQQAAARRRQREREKLRAELTEAERELREKATAARAAERELKRAERAVAALRKKLDDLS